MNFNFDLFDMSNPVVVTVYFMNLRNKEKYQKELLMESKG